MSTPNDPSNPHSDNSASPRRTPAKKPVRRPRSDTAGLRRRLTAILAKQRPREKASRRVVLPETLAFACLRAYGSPRTFEEFAERGYNYLLRTTAAAYPLYRYISKWVRRLDSESTEPQINTGRRSRIPLKYRIASFLEERMRPDPDSQRGWIWPLPFTDNGSSSSSSLPLRPCLKPSLSFRLLSALERRERLRRYGRAVTIRMSRHLVRLCGGPNEVAYCICAGLESVKEFQDARQAALVRHRKWGVLHYALGGSGMRKK